MELGRLMQLVMGPAWAGWVFFGLATFTTHFWYGSGLMGQLDLRLEANLAAWYSGLTLVMASLSCLSVLPVRGNQAQAGVIIIFSGF